MIDVLEQRGTYNASSVEMADDAHQDLAHVSRFSLVVALLEHFFVSKDGEGEERAVFGEEGRHRALFS